MQLPRWAWIFFVIIMAFALMVGTVWWLRARSLRALPALSSVSEPSSSPVVSPSSSTSTNTEVSPPPENLPIFFAPEVPLLPGIIVAPADASPSQAPSVEGSSFPGEGSALDDDGDGLTNDQERQLGTDPKKIDTDADRLSDKDEVTKYRTNPLLSDTDGDGYADAQEIQNGYNPLGAGACLSADCVF